MTTALVLGGGGVTGIAWEIGLLHGLAEVGVDLTTADTVIGTSAGSVVGAQVTSGTPLEELYAEQSTPAHAEIGADFGVTTMLHLLTLMVLPASARGRRARVGTAARKAHPEPATERLRVIGERLTTSDGAHLQWPDRDLRVTAVDADSGAFTVFDRSGDVDLVHAVAASCAVPLVWPPVEIAGHHYVDGGIRSSANADLAKGSDVVVAVAPLPRSFGRHHSLPNQLARTGAGRTAVVAPDAAALTAIGKNVLDPAKRVDAAHAGYYQAASLVEKLVEELGGSWPG